MMTALLLALAAPTAAIPVCDQAAADRGVQPAMNACAQREFLIADAAMNAQWKRTRDAMKRRDADPDFQVRDDRPGYWDTLLAAQRAWLAYRDAHCRSEGYEARGGSLEPLLVAMCKRTLTVERTKQLRSLIAPR